MIDETKPADRALFVHDDGVVSDAKAATESALLPVPLPAAALAPRKPGRKVVTTLTLSSRTCKWPIGDPAASDFHYCGQPPQSGRPYCDEHDRMSYQATPRKRASPSFR
jgi:GcrA cell cycle regulator